MLIFIMLVGLIFFIAGGVGLFYVNINLTLGSQYWIMGNITFGTFILVGIIILIFMAVYNSQFE